MLAVSNTSPLRYFISAGHVELLSKLFGTVLIPMGVAQELSDIGAPLAVRRWIAQPPKWLRIHTLCTAPDEDLIAVLDRGESEAIQLTLEQKADVLIIDERRGRAIARRRGLPITRAMGVLGDSYRRGLIDNPLQALNDIRTQGFRVSDELIMHFGVLLRTVYAR